MKIVIASDSYKESLSAEQVCQSIKQGLMRIIPAAEYQLVPIADGGEGTMNAIVNVTGGTFNQVKVEGPLGESVDAKFLAIDASTCVIEIASACGLELLARELRDPMKTSSFGVGQLMAAAFETGISKMIIGLGGSATNDGGAGMLAALGGCFYRKNGKVFVPTGGTLLEIDRIDLSALDPRLSACDIVLACDVTVPLCGNNGASYMFAPQKGAKSQDLAVLDQGLEYFAQLLEGLGGANVRSSAGAGAAGGIGAALMSLLDISVDSGIDVVLDAIGFEDILQGASLVISGEGRVDEQTAHGKAPIGVARRAKAHNIPVVLLCGAMSPGYEAVYQHGVNAVFSATPAVLDLPSAIEQAPVNLANLAENVGRLLVISPL